jgi:hypothetical protein
MTENLRDSESATEQKNANRAKVLLEQQENTFDSIPEVDPISCCRGFLETRERLGAVPTPLRVQATRRPHVVQVLRTILPRCRPSPTRIFRHSSTSLTLTKSLLSNSTVNSIALKTALHGPEHRGRLVRFAAQHGRLGSLARVLLRRSRSLLLVCSVNREQCQTLVPQPQPI